MEFDPKLIGASIRARLQLLKKTQSIIGKEAQINQGQVSRFVNGKFLTPSPNLCKLCKLLGLPEIDTLKPALKVETESIIRLAEKVCEDADRARLLLGILKAFDRT